MIKIYVPVQYILTIMQIKSEKTQLFMGNNVMPLEMKLISFKEQLKFLLIMALKGRMIVIIFQ